VLLNYLELSNLDHVQNIRSAQSKSYVAPSRFVNLMQTAEVLIIGSGGDDIRCHYICVLMVVRVVPLAPANLAEAVLGVQRLSHMIGDTYL